MNRSQFLKHCASGLCCCATAGVLAPAVSAAAETKPAEDWRISFARRRYAKLLEILAGKMDAAALSDILRQLGSYCASSMSLLQRHKGDVDGFIREFCAQWHEDIVYDREKGIITVVGPERSDCFCPLIDLSCPKAACNCSLGWQQCVYETLLGKKVKVELKDSVLRGGKRCVFEVRVLEAKA